MAERPCHHVDASLAERGSTSDRVRGVGGVGLWRRQSVGARDVWFAVCVSPLVLERHITTTLRHQPGRWLWTSLWPAVSCVDEAKNDEVTPATGHASALAADPSGQRPTVLTALLS